MAINLFDSRVKAHLGEIQLEADEKAASIQLHEAEALNNDVNNEYTQGTVTIASLMQY
jgi:hypothetical protein